MVWVWTLVCESPFPQCALARSNYISQGDLVYCQINHGCQQSLLSSVNWSVLSGLVLKSPLSFLHSLIHTFTSNVLHFILFMLLQELNVPFFSLGWTSWVTFLENNIVYLKWLVVPLRGATQLCCHRRWIQFLYLVDFPSNDMWACCVTSPAPWKLWSQPQCCSCPLAVCSQSFHINHIRWGHFKPHNVWWKSLFLLWMSTIDLLHWWNPSSPWNGFEMNRFNYHGHHKAQRGKSRGPNLEKHWRRTPCSRGQHK